MKKIKLILTVAFSFFVVIATAQYQKCGTWRWGVKTLTDGQSSAILKTSPVTVSIEALTVKYPFSKKLTISDKNLERQSDEKQLVKLSCYVVGLKEEKSSTGDHDYHMILKSPDSDSTMVAEIPSPDCPEAAADPQLKKLYTQLRQWVCDNIIVPTGTLKYIDPVAVDIVGVPFWDMPSHGSGASFFGREIHPVINIAKAGTMAPAEPAGDNSGTKVSDAAFTSNNLPYGVDASKINEPATTNPKDLIIIIALAAIFGICGQVIRVFAGIRKIKESSPADSKDIKSILSNNNSQILFSLLIALVVGSVAGILAYLSSSQTNFVFDKATIIALVAAGYAGTDLIEGFIVKR